MNDKPSADFRRATQRPKAISIPEHWPRNVPLPEPEPMAENAADPDSAENSDKERDPTRYGDWVHKGIAVDF